MIMSKSNKKKFLTFFLHLIVLYQLQMQYKDLYQQNRLNALILRNYGFQEAPSSSFPYQLYRAELVQSASCLRDTMMTAMWNFQKLQNVLIQACTVKRWKFYNIIVCSMADCSSQVKRTFVNEEIARLNCQWQVAQFRTIFIPICMNQAQMQEIVNYCNIGGENWIPYPVTFDTFNQQLSSIMKCIKTQAKYFCQSNEEKLFADNNFFTAITFSVEASSNMNGCHKWENLANAISFQLNCFGQKDLISGVLFSSQPWVIAQINQKPAITQQNEIILQRYLQNRGRVQNGGRGGDEPQYQAYAAPPPPPPPSSKKTIVILLGLTLVVIIGLVIAFNVR